jgi:hypothetical protein
VSDAPTPDEPRDPDGPDRRGLVALGLVVGVLTVCVAVLLLTRGHDTAPTTADGKATSSTTDGADDEEAIVEGDADASATTATTAGSTTVDTSRAGVTQAVADGIYDGADGVISREEATCMAEALVAQVGAERVIQLGDEALGTDREASPLAALSPAEQDAAVAAMLPCADAETLDHLTPD